MYKEYISFLQLNLLLPIVHEKTDYILGVYSVSAVL